MYGSFERDLVQNNGFKIWRKNSNSKLLSLNQSEIGKANPQKNISPLPDISFLCYGILKSISISSYRVIAKN